jgi:hypothetical protein
MINNQLMLGNAKMQPTKKNFIGGIVTSIGFVIKG